jgi:hypothetical protein
MVQELQEPTARRLLLNLLVSTRSRSTRPALNGHGSFHYELFLLEAKESRK